MRKEKGDVREHEMDAEIGKGEGGGVLYLE